MTFLDDSLNFREASTNFLFARKESKVNKMVDPSATLHLHTLRSSTYRESQARKGDFECLGFGFVGESAGVSSYSKRLPPLRRAFAGFA